ncbi:hypothetical protein [Propioniciclava soli]|uniref:hypothetical protein n=1 Tax=Propioniciclava soli TaxID=2775081 RepID=UPI001E28346A|nr:hypothetical protein [Propioniciclava soli]
MMFKRCAIATTAVCATVVTLSACVGDATPTPTPTLSTPTTPFASPTPTPTPDAGQAEAAAVVERYIQIVDQIAVEGAPLDSLYEAASGDVARQQLRVMQELLGDGYVMNGRRYVEVRDVQGEAAPYIVQACVDNSEITITDAEGRSMIPEGQATLTLWQYSVRDVSGRLLVMEEEAVSSPC